MVAAVVAFAINYACYFSEIYRGGIEAVPKGQTEAGQVLGMTKTQIFFKVTLLQVVKRILAPMGNEVITLVKDTSLANTIANKEIIMMAKEYSAKGLIWPLFSTASSSWCSWAHSPCCLAGPKRNWIISADEREEIGSWHCLKLRHRQKLWRYQKYSRISHSRWNRAKRWRSSARPAPVRPPCCAA